MKMILHDNSFRTFFVLLLCCFMVSLKSFNSVLDYNPSFKIVILHMKKKFPAGWMAEKVWKGSFLLVLAVVFCSIFEWRVAATFKASATHVYNFRETGPRKTLNLWENLKEVSAKDPVVQEDYDFYRRHGDVPSPGVGHWSDRHARMEKVLVHMCVYMISITWACNSFSCYYAPVSNNLCSGQASWQPQADNAFNRSGGQTPC